jgi:hypothetical protein
MSGLRDFVLLEGLSGDVEKRSPKSMIPLTKLRYSGIRFSQFSKANRWQT